MKKLKQFIRVTRCWLAGKIGGPNYPYIIPVIDGDRGDECYFGLIDIGHQSEVSYGYRHGDYVRLIKRKTYHI